MSTSGLLVSRIKHTAWMSVGRHPQFLQLFKLYGRITGRELGVVDSTTDIVIEGYPRSANTYALVAFKLAQPTLCKVAHHIHGPAQVIVAVRKNIPAIVLIRDPVDAITSLMVRSPQLEPRQLLYDYIAFYKNVLPYSSNYVVAEFCDVVNDFGEVIELVNIKYGTHFHKYTNTEENEQQCYRLIEQMDTRDTRKTRVSEETVARPSGDRGAKKSQFQDLLQEPSLQSLREQAYELYKKMLNI